PCSPSSTTSWTCPRSRLDVWSWSPGRWTWWRWSRTWRCCWRLRHLAELMGGTVGFESESGRGSTFWATVKFSGPVDPHTPLAPSPAALRGRRALVVANNVATGSILMQQLRALEMNAELVGDGAGARARLA